MCGPHRAMDGLHRLEGEVGLGVIEIDGWDWGGVEGQKPCRLFISGTGRILRILGSGRSRGDNSYFQERSGDSKWPGCGDEEKVGSRRGGEAGLLAGRRC